MIYSLSSKILMSVTLLMILHFSLWYWCLQLFRWYFTSVCDISFDELLMFLDHDSALAVCLFESNYMKLNTDKFHLIISSNKHEIFFSAVWLSHGQLWVILKGVASNLMLITTFVQFWPKDHRELSNRVGSLSLAECLQGFELGTVQF